MKFLTLEQWNRTLAMGRPALFSDQADIAKSGSGQITVPIGDRDVIVVRTLISEAVLNQGVLFAASATMDIDGEPIIKDNTPIEALACNANQPYSGVPAFVAGAKSIIKLKIIDGGEVDATNTVRMTLVCREILR